MTWLPGAGPNPTHHHAVNDVCWYILVFALARKNQTGGPKNSSVLVFARQRKNHVIANASETEEASLIFCYIGVGNTRDAKTVRLDKAPEAADA